MAYKCDSTGDLVTKYEIGDKKKIKHINKTARDYDTAVICHNPTFPLLFSV